VDTPWIHLDSALRQDVGGRSSPIVSVWQLSPCDYYDLVIGEIFPEPQSGERLKGA
jgi:hypothetical protein